MADSKISSADEDGLKVLVDAKVLNPNITLSQLIEVTKRLDGGEDHSAARWAFIVKGKFIYRDDSATAAKSATAWPEQ